MNKLEQLHKVTKVVADTGDFESIKVYQPIDATTNPSLILKAAQQSQYRHLIDDALQADADPEDRNEMNRILDQIAVNFGVEILNIVPGRVSTEVDARLSFDAAATIERADHLISLYEQAGISRERVLLKIASTWEGIRAAEHLERKGIHCNLTLMFSIVQAVAAAESGVTLVSPFVGRILDWYKKHEGVDGYASADDPGVRSVTQIYNYYKQHNYNTLVMGASFRNKEEILELAGCDLLTIAPTLMQELQDDQGELVRKLQPDQQGQARIADIDASEAGFRLQMNQDPMATEKLAEGIRGFITDTIKLEAMISESIKQRAA